MSAAMRYRAAHPRFTQVEQNAEAAQSPRRAMSAAITYKAAHPGSTQVVQSVEAAQSPTKAATKTQKCVGGQPLWMVPTVVHVALWGVL